MMRVVVEYGASPSRRYSGVDCQQPKDRKEVEEEGSVLY